MANYTYVVHPPGEKFDTRHDAVAFRAIHRRKYDYHPDIPSWIDAYDESVESRVESIIADMREHAETEVHDECGEYAAVIQRKWAHRLEQVIE